MIWYDPADGRLVALGGYDGPIDGPLDDIVRIRPPATGSGGDAVVTIHRDRVIFEEHYEPPESANPPD
ncbi:MAG: hypothetical protein OXH09_15010 [Gammaproteobacteria bacterium]|nr:hypothetical protein [Gammaproteobacteria bacterium]